MDVSLASSFGEKDGDPRKWCREESLVGSRDLWPWPLMRQQLSPRALDITLPLLSHSPPLLWPLWEAKWERSGKWVCLLFTNIPQTAHQQNSTVPAVEEWICLPLCGREKFRACPWIPQAEGLVFASLLALCDIGRSVQAQRCCLAVPQLEGRKVRQVNFPSLLSEFKESWGPWGSTTIGIAWSLDGQVKWETEPYYIQERPQALCRLFQVVTWVWISQMTLSQNRILSLFYQITD